MTEAYLLKVSGDKIVIPRSKNIKNDEVVEIVVNRVFVDVNVKKKIERNGVIRIY